jgi:hypothetical protein
MGSTHFRTGTFPRVRTEMSPQVLAYKLQRVIRIVGAQKLIAQMRAQTRTCTSTFARRGVMASA